MTKNGFYLTLLATAGFAAIFALPAAAQSAKPACHQEKRMVQPPNCIGGWYSQEWFMGGYNSTVACRQYQMETVTVCGNKRPNETRTLTPTPPTSRAIVRENRQAPIRQGPPIR